MADHEFKTWPVPYQAVVDGRKTYEVREIEQERTVPEIGDRLRLREWDPKARKYTGRESWVDVVYVTRAHEWAKCSPGLHVIGIKKSPAEPREAATLDLEAVTSDARAAMCKLPNCISHVACVLGRHVLALVARVRELEAGVENSTVVRAIRQANKNASNAHAAMEARAEAAEAEVARLRDDFEGAVSELDRISGERDAARAEATRLQALYEQELSRAQKAESEHWQALQEVVHYRAGVEAYRSVVHRTPDGERVMVLSMGPIDAWERQDAARRAEVQS